MKTKSGSPDLHAQREILSTFCSFVEEFNKIPQRQDLKNLGVTKSAVEHHFGNLNKLLDAAKKFRPNLFMKEPDEKLVAKLRSMKSGNYIFTCAVPGQEAFNPFIKALMAFAKKKNARLMIFPIQSIDKNSMLDKNLPSSYLVHDEELLINKNLHIWNFGVKAETANPLSGLDKFTRTSSSIIVPSPKQMHKLIPNMSYLPRALIATGAVTLPQYHKNKSGANASKDHVCGAYYVEIDGEMFFPRNLMALSDGSFIDLGVQYMPNGRSRKLERKEIARVDGDDHAAQADMDLVSTLDEIQQTIPAGIKVSHDLWDQVFNNHHEQHNHILRAQRAMSGESSFERERQITQKFLRDRGKIFDEVVVVPSNHNDALNRYLAAGGYLTDYQNWRDGHHLATAQFSGVDPVKFATLYYEQFNELCNQYFDAVAKGKKNAAIKLSIKPAISNIRFLKSGESFMFGGYELGYHGSDGPNGTRGTPAAMSLVHGPSVTGHTHSPYLFGRNVVVGTGTYLPSSPLSPGYAKGKPSSWLNAFAFVYAPRGHKEGSAQLISVINGRYCRDSGKKTSKKKK